MSLYILDEKEEELYERQSNADSKITKIKLVKKGRATR